jgi:hypothetical protein
MLQQRDSGQALTVPVATPAPPDIETSTHFWHPNRFGVQYGPATFRRDLQAIHPDLDVTWHPLKERWLVWYKRPRIQHHLCQGWLLLFVVEDSQQAYVGLDTRVLAAVYEQSGFKWGSGKAYWARVEGESQREAASREADREQEVADVGADHWDHTKIQVSMCGHSSGSKFVNHHAGD